MRINSNISALRAQRHLGESAQALSRALQRLSSGQRISRAADDASGLALSEGLLAQSRGLAQAARNANDSLAFFQVAESTLSTQSDILQRMRELTLQAANGSLSNSERSYLDEELKALYSEFVRVSQAADFSGMRILDGSLEQLSVQLGNSKNSALDFDLSNTSASDLFSYQETAGSGQYGETNALSLGHVIGTNKDLKIADLNGDGIEDLIYLSRTSGITGQVDIFLGDGDGNYSLSQSISGNHVYLNPLQLADLNGDGTQDLIIADASVAFYYLGNGDGTFDFARSESGQVDSTYGDIDGDGMADRLEVDTDNFSYITLQISLGRGDGSFSDAAVEIYNESYPYSAEQKLLDFDGDGDLDAVYGLFDINPNTAVQVAFNNGNLNFSSPTTVSGASVNLNSIYSDLNGDGRIDILSDNRVYIQSGTGSFTQTATLSSGAIGAISKVDTRDFNSDGNKDIFFLYSNGQIATFSADSNRGEYSLANLINSESSAGAFGVTDSNSDQALDLITAKISTGELLITNGVPKEYTRRAGTDFSVSIATQDDARELLGILDHIQNNINSARSQMGAYSNRLESAINSISLTKTNLQIARSQIIDADFAEETAELIRQQILQQASITVLSQANTSIQIVLSLFDL